MHLSMIVAALALQAPAPKAGAAKADRWFADFDQATDVARSAGKDLLVDFTGSDWCPWCVKLHEEVFAFDSFLDAAEKSYVLVSLDYPRSEEAKKKVPNPARNAELAQRYRIGAYPTVLLVTVAGDAYAKTGFQEGGPEKYVESLKPLATNGKKELAEANGFLAAFDAAKGPDKPKQVDEAIARLAALKRDSPFVTKYASVVSAGYQLDPENKSGLELKAFEALLKAGIVDDATAAAAKSLDPKNEKGLIERLVQASMSSISSKEAIAPWLKRLDDLLAAGPFKDAKAGKRLLGSAAFMAKQHLNDLERAKGYAKKLKELGLDSPEDEELKQLVESILSGTD
jgi:thiol-disulfide isomerase/thioredoxin